MIPAISYRAQILQEINDDLDRSIATADRIIKLLQNPPSPPHSDSGDIHLLKPRISRLRWGKRIIIHSESGTTSRSLSPLPPSPRISEKRKKERRPPFNFFKPIPPSKDLTLR